MNRHEPVCEIPLTEHVTHSETQVGPCLIIRMIVGAWNKTHNSYLLDVYNQRRSILQMES